MDNLEQWNKLRDLVYEVFEPKAVPSLFEPLNIDNAWFRCNDQALFVGKFLSLLYPVGIMGKEYKFDFNYQDEGGFSLLHYYVLGENVYRLNMLLHTLLVHISDLNLPDNLGNTPLHLAAIIGNVEVVSELVKFGADVTVLNHAKQTPEMLAKSLGNKDVINFFYKLAWSKSKVGKFFAKLFQILLEPPMEKGGTCL